MYARAKALVAGALVLGALVAPAAAGANVSIIEPPSSGRPWQVWADEAKVPTPAVTVTVVESTAEICSIALACSDGSTIWIVPSLSGKEVFYRELGHVFDVAYLRGQPEREAEVLALLGHTSMPWGWGTPLIDNHVGAEWFSSAYSLCARLTHIDPNWSYSAGDGVLRGTRLRELCGYIRSFPG